MKSVEVVEIQLVSMLEREVLFVNVVALVEEVEGVIWHREVIGSPMLLVESLNLLDLLVEHILRLYILFLVSIQPRNVPN